MFKNVIVLWDLDHTLIFSRRLSEEFELLFLLTRNEWPERFEFTTTNTEEVWCNKQVLNEIASLPSVNMFCTSWGNFAESKFAPAVGVSWSSTPQPENAEHTPGHGWWKIEAIQTLMLQNPEIWFIFVDDAIADNASTLGDIENLLQTGMLTAIVPGSRGVTADIVQFIKRIQTDSKFIGSLVEWDE